MEDRRTAIAILLIIMMVMLYSEVVLAPSMRQIRPTPTAPTQLSPSQTSPSGAAPSAPVTNASIARPAGAQVTTAAGLPTTTPEVPPTPAEIRAAPSTTIETDNYIATISHLGGRLLSFQIKSYLDHLGASQLLDLVSISDGGVLPLGVYSGLRSDLRTNYVAARFEPPLTVVGNRVVVPPGKELAIILEGTLSDGTAISKKFSFKGDSYLFGVNVALEQAATDGTNLWLEWARFLPETMVNDQVDPWTFSLLSNTDKIQHLGLATVEMDGLSQPLAVQWLGIADKYFSAILLPELQGLNARYGRLGSQFFHRVAGSPAQGNFSLFVGPKEYETLQEIGFQLERSVDLGFFSFLAYPLLVLIRLFYSVFNNYGLAIVGLTLVIKGLFFPLTRASLRSMKSMQEIQPEMQALRERIKDPTQLNQELLQLYKRKGVNPLGGCLPILLQIPVFFGLYSALLHAIELRHAPFALWVTDLSVPESLSVFGINFPVMILLMGVTMFYQQYTTPMPTIDPTQRKMMLWISAVFPVMFLIFPFPSGLALYMLTNTSISVIQQAYLRNDSHANPGRATTVASLAIFGLAYVLTLL